MLHPLPESSVLGIPRHVGALAATRLFSLAGKARMALELFVRPRPDASGDESIASFIGRRFGAEAVTYLAEPLLAGIHAGDVHRLSMRALFPRFLEGYLYPAFTGHLNTSFKSKWAVSGWLYRANMIEE